MEKVTDCKHTYWEEAIKQYYKWQECKHKKA
ncbi:hypothetical protein IKM_05599 [Bacillus mycoides]|nr:hypothetical protein IKM_05599 [Bacillus mycoides]